MSENNEDKRPDPKPRKQEGLWQAYLWWNELVEMRKKHTLRLSSIEAGKSNMDPLFEKSVMQRMDLDALVRHANKLMINAGEEVGPIWDWMTSIRGLGAGSLAAQLSAQIDDIGKFATVSKLWRFSGWAVIDGKRERNKKGEKSHYNRRLKGICWNIAVSFIKQQTPVYVDVYYREKARLRRLHPEPEPTNGSSPWPFNFTDQHIHRMAQRKMVKTFLCHVFHVWRRTEGLPATKPYVHDIAGHSNYIPPPNFPLQG